MDGSIALESTPGQGTCISIMLPTFEAPSHQVAPAEETIRVQRDIKVHLVEDEVLVRKAICRMLSREAIAHEVCTDGDEADLKLKDEAFDVLCIDAHMPGTPTLEVIQSFKKKQPSGKVLVCSGNIRSRDLLEYIQEHCIQVLTKPFSQNELLEAISRDTRG